ncbi:hypothetical protein KGQ27_02650 [Patescibacteria group bacterium]|nr:hypothetical protein [Patescibacteria group bacterium]MDE1946770.1 hypothetical protein [Patescibacteria group bacterium]MDE2233596.1 hypothetical protein [Patescibacteria group bacterium]
MAKKKHKKISRTTSRRFTRIYRSEMEKLAPEFEKIKAAETITAKDMEITVT